MQLIPTATAFLGSIEHDSTAFPVSDLRELVRIPMLFSYPNVWNTCLLILRERGYRLFLLGDPDEDGGASRCSWNAEKDGMNLRGNNPIELLGLVGIQEYHSPSKHTPYWWRIDGPNVIAHMEIEWRILNTVEAGEEPGHGDV